jgi:2-oxoisovalerate dehydrogenase E1 component alpha subunit
MTTTETKPVKLPPRPAQPFKNRDFARSFYREMVRTRVLEERLIKMVRTGDGFFWIGGPGEEAFSVALGKLVKKGQGLAHDYLHLHYRSNGVLLSMGEPMVNFVRQMKNVATDPYSGGRNFVAHVAKKEWNVVPVTSTIETQYAVAPGTARAQRRARLRGQEAGVTVVVGGDAGTAEGDFASCLIWASRPGEELPLLMVVTNNSYGISTPAATQHGERNIADRAKAFGIQTGIVDGNNPEKVYPALETALDYVRSTGKPYLLEASCSRLYGHSSSSGANFVSEETCCIDLFEKRLLKQGWLSEEEAKKIFEEAQAEAAAALETVRGEKWPDHASVLAHTFAGSPGGLPGRDF